MKFTLTRLGKSALTGREFALEVQLDDKGKYGNGFLFDTTDGHPDSPKNRLLLQLTHQDLLDLSYEIEGYFQSGGGC